MKPSPDIKALIFDFDGTIVNTMPQHYAAWEESLAPYNIIFSKQDFYGAAGQHTFHIAKRLARYAGLGKTEARQIYHSKEKAFSERISTAALIPEVYALIDEYSSKLPMAIATGSKLQTIQALVDRFNLGEHIQAIITADDVQKGKPNPETFLQAAKRLKVQPEHCLVYEDADLGIEAAHAANMQVCDVRNHCTCYRNNYRG